MKYCVRFSYSIIIFYILSSCYLLNYTQTNSQNMRIIPPRTRDCKGGEAAVCEANNVAERRNPGKPGFCSRQDAKMAAATKN